MNNNDHAHSCALVNIKYIHICHIYISWIFSRASMIFYQKWLKTYYKNALNHMHGKSDLIFTHETSYCDSSDAFECYGVIDV